MVTIIDWIEGIIGFLRVPGVSKGMGFPNIP